MREGGDDGGDAARAAQALRRLRSRRRRRDAEPEGFGEAVGAMGLMLCLVTAGAFVGYAWTRYNTLAAHAEAVAIVTRIAAQGRHALIPLWGGYGRGPEAPTAKATFEAVHRLGPFRPRSSGACVIASAPPCTGTRYRCTVSGDTATGPLHVKIGLCDHGRGTPLSFDLIDATIPSTGSDTGNRADVVRDRDGLIRYGTTPPPPDSLGVKIRRGLSPGTPNAAAGGKAP